MKANIHLTIEGTIEIEEKGLPLIEKDYGKRLKERRLSRGLTPAQLSGMSGVSKSHIYRIERGERSPNISVVAKLERVLGGGEK